MKWPLSSKLTPCHYRRNLFFRLLLLGLLGFLLGFPLDFLLGFRFLLRPFPGASVFSFRLFLLAFVGFRVGRVVGLGVGMAVDAIVTRS